MILLKLNKVVFFVVVILSAAALDAQNTTNSPYSKYGIGILRPDGFMRSLSMGGVGLGLRSNKDINIINPAAHSALTITTFEVGVTNNALSLNDGKETQFKNNTYINHLSFGMPVIMNKWGLGFGVLPYSSVGYDYKEVVNNSFAGDVTFRRRGKGGLNKAYLTNAVQFNLDSTSLIAFGANTVFVFGSMQQEETATYGDIANALSLWHLQQSSVADFGTDFGAQYQKYLNNKGKEPLKLIVGATYTLATNLNSKKTELITSYVSSTGTSVDTALFIDKAREIIQLPSQIGMGLSLAKNNKWTIGIDYRVFNWGQKESNSTIFKYNSNYSLAAGIEWIPKHDAYNYYFKRVAYRFGTRYNTSYILINNKPLTEYGITFGMGLPIKRQESALPNLNFGFEYGKRGQAKGGLIEETFFNFNIGITINDRWFIKRKYD